MRRFFLAWVFGAWATALRRGFALFVACWFIGHAQVVVAQEATGGEETTPSNAHETPTDEASLLTEALQTAEDAARLAGQRSCPTPCHLRHRNQIPKGFKKDPPKQGSQSWSSGGKSTTAKPAANKPKAQAAEPKKPAAEPPVQKPAQASPPKGEFTPRNQKLAGKKHPVTNVPFDKDGYPDFRSAGVVKKEVKIKFSGSRDVDYKEANRIANQTATPKGLTWHHHQDGTTMQLVPTDIHAKTGHSGGMAAMKGKP